MFKSLKEEIEIILLSLIGLSLLLLFVGIFTNFFKWKDYTLLAGILGFSGAIIGGLITLKGVRETIKFTKKTDDQSKKPEKIKNATELIKLLEIFEDNIRVSDEDIRSKKRGLHHLEDNIKRFFDDNEIYIKAAYVDSSIYKQINDFKSNTIRGCSHLKAEHAQVFRMRDKNKEELNKIRFDITRKAYNETSTNINGFIAEVEVYIENL